MPFHSFPFPGADKEQRIYEKQKTTCRNPPIIRSLRLSDRWKEIEENNRLGKTRHNFKKIRDTKGTFHAQMGSIKDRNSMDLTEAKDIKKSWQEYIEELYKKGLNDHDNHDGLVTHLESNTLECEVKWTLRSVP